MKNWFPFTDYDFYAYLTSGALFLAALDYAITGGTTLLNTEWGFVLTLLVVALAYVVGQLLATPASIVVEHGFARGVLSPPAMILLGLQAPNWLERFIGRYVIGRYYTPFPDQVRRKIIARAAKELDVPMEEIIDGEAVFQVAFPVARKSEDTRARLDDFRNQYGFCRNLGFVGLISLVMIAIRAYQLDDSTAWYVAVFAGVIAVGMTARFLKFYSSFAAEVLRPMSRGDSE